MKAVYGPVSSWRLGRSLGIDPICRTGKVCSFDCVYCQLGKTKKKTLERKIYVSTKKVLKDLNEALSKVEADVITFSGIGEPTLAENLKEVIDYVKEETSLPLAILTNSTLLTDKDVKEALGKLDIVVAKLDAFDKESFNKINQPPKGLSFEEYVEGIKFFRKNYSGKFALQMMFVEENKNFAKKMAEIAKEIDPDEIQINTPLRPCMVKPLNREELVGIKNNFKDFKNVISVYEAKKYEVRPLDLKEIQKRKRPKP